jgi:hypothetical protein
METAPYRFKVNPPSTTLAQRPYYPIPGSASNRFSLRQILVIITIIDNIHEIPPLSTRPGARHKLLHFSMLKGLGRLYASDSSE